ncbi:hypothetical protein [Candidatus Poriferisodalis sp.]|uniref:hypothetical protein n=1 Tax=Candidatus Poriferisodalis sp. TaxID=3101277 RepID=UPI003B011126
MDLQLAQQTYRTLHADAAEKFFKDHGHLSAQEARKQATERILTAKEAHGQATVEGGSALDWKRKEVKVLKGTAKEKEAAFYRLGGEIATLIIIAQNKESLDGVIDLDAATAGRPRSDGPPMEPFSAPGQTPTEVAAISLGGDAELVAVFKEAGTNGKIALKSADDAWNHQQRILTAADEIQTTSGGGGTQVLTTSQSIRRPDWFQRAAWQMPTIYEQLMMETTDQASLVYMEESVASGKPTNKGDAASKAEGATSAQVAFQLTEQTVGMRELGAYAVVSKIALEDVSQIRRLLDIRMPQSVQYAVEVALFGAGDGTGTTLRGLSSAVTGESPIQLSTSAFASAVIDSDMVVGDVLASVFDILTATHNQNRPNVLWAHPDLVRDLFRASTTQYGPIIPTVRGLQLPAFAAYGMGITLSTHLSPLRAAAAGKYNIGYVGDTMELGFVTRRAMETEIGMINDQMIRGRLTYSSTCRCGFAHYRPAAWRKLTVTLT